VGEDGLRGPLRGASAATAGENDDGGGGEKRSRRGSLPRG